MAARQSKPYQTLIHELLEKSARKVAEFAAPDTTARDTIFSWESSSKTRIFLAELLCFAEPECPSKHCSTTWRAEKHSKIFWRDFLLSRVNRPSLLSKKQNTSCSHVPKCAF